MPSDIRQQVKAQIIKVIAEAEDQGKDGAKAAIEAFPEVPTPVIYECWADWDHDRTEAWWDSIEKTIDAEIVRNALSAPR